MITEKVTENIYVFIDRNFYDTVVGAIVFPSKLIAIDSGFHVPNVKTFRNEVEKITKKKFEFLFLTHRHGDHVFGNQIFKDCKIISPKQLFAEMTNLKKRVTPEVIQKEKARLKDSTALDGLEIILPNLTIENELQIFDKEVSLIYKTTGGHTSDSSYVYCPQYKVLFTGDNLFNNYYPYGGDKSCNPEQWMNTLNEYLELNAEIIIPGHGKPCGIKPIQETLTFLKTVKNKMKKLSTDGKREEEILKECYKIPFYPNDESNPDDVEMKKSTLKQWYDCWINKI